MTVHFADTSGGDGEDGRDRGGLLTGGEHSHTREGMLAVDGADLLDLEREVHRAVFEVPQPPADAFMPVVGGRVGQAEVMQLDVGFCQREQPIEVACNECAQETAHDLTNVLIVLARELWGADLVERRWVKGAFDVGEKLTLLHLHVRTETCSHLVKELELCCLWGAL